MPNPIFQQPNMQRKPGGNPAVGLSDMVDVIRTIVSGNQDQQRQKYMELRDTFPEFREFSDRMEGKTVTQAYGEYGQDPNAAWSTFFGRR